MTIRRIAATTLASTLAAGAALGFSTTVAAGSPAAPSARTIATEAAALPSVNHERLLLAAQLDPSKPDRSLTAGAESSVKVVKKALIAKGLLVSSDTDGHFGVRVRQAWRDWESRVHATRNPWSSNGLPGLTELTKLGADRFTISHKVDPGGWVKEVQADAPPQFRNQLVDERTRAMFRKAESIAGNMTISQGRGDAGESEGTHLGGGVIDIRVMDNLSKTSARVAALRKVGFAAWHRDWSGNQHIHAVAVADPYVAYGSHAELCQVFQFRFGGEGRSCSNSVAGANRPLIWWEQYQRSL